MTYGGAGEEWTMDCSGPEDMMLYGRNLNSDIKCSIEMYKEALPIQGKWKQVSETGVYEAYKMLGKNYLNVLTVAVSMCVIPCIYP